MHPMVAKSGFVMNQLNLPIKSCICILRVEVLDGSYTLVPTDEDEGAGGDVHYVTVEQDPGQSPEVGVSVLTVDIRLCRKEETRVLTKSCSTWM
jgi:hypothetical protein